MNDNVTDIWKLYEKGKDFQNKMNLVWETTQNYRFYEGDHWNGLDSGGEKMPIVEIIKPIIDYKTTILTTNQLEALYTPQNYTAPPMEQDIMREVCKQLSHEFQRYWEQNNMDTVLYDLVMDAQISGDAYVYLYFEPSKEKKNGVEKEGNIRSELVPNTSIMFGDENERDIQKQPYILIISRREVNAVKQRAKAYGCSKQLIEQIVPDELKEQMTGNTDEVDQESKCLCVLKMWKEDGKLHCAESTKTVVYRKDDVIPSKLYPIAPFVWERRQGQCRGVSEVHKYIPNQIWVNRIEAYRLISAKIAAFPRIVFSSNLINKEDINAVGAALEVEDNDIAKAMESVGYINPAPMSQDAKLVLEEVMTYTKDAAGAADVATGREKFDNYSALLAIQQSAQAPLARQTQRLKSTIEAIARIVFEYWCAYFPNGLQIPTRLAVDNPLMASATPLGTEAVGQEIDVMIKVTEEDLRKLDVNIRVDITPTTPINKLTEQQKADNLLIGQQITFDEYVEILNDEEPMKPKLQRIVEERKKQQDQMAEMQSVIEQQQGELEQARMDSEMKDANLLAATQNAYMDAAIDIAAGKE